MFWEGGKQRSLEVEDCFAPCLGRNMQRWGETQYLYLDLKIERNQNKNKDTFPPSRLSSASAKTMQNVEPTNIAMR